MLLKNKHPNVGHVYAVLTGTYVGEMLVFVEETNSEYKFISLPKNINREVPKDKFVLGLSDKIVEPVEKIPNGIFKLLKKQYIYNTHNSK